MQVSTVKCDICGKLKGETNGWWKARMSGTLLISTAHDWIEHIPGTDICSESCATKALSQWMAGQGK